MIQCLCVYLSYVYDENPVKTNLGINHSIKYKDLTWDPKNQVFITSDERRNTELIHLGTNTATSGRETQLMSSVDRNLGSTLDTIAGRMMSQREQDLIQL